MRNKKIWITIAVIVVVILLGFFIQRETNASPNSRVILDHTYHSYIVPMCFEESDPTNFLEEATLEKAHNLDYKPHTDCTLDAVAPTTDPLIISLLKEMGIINRK